MRMSFVFHLHSGLRYLVLLAGASTILYSAFSLATRRPWDRTGFIINTAFVGLLDLQILAGLLLIFVGVYYAALAGHIVMMLLAAAIAHVCSAKNKRKSPPGFLLPLSGAIGAFLFIAGGIMAIQRSII